MSENGKKAISRVDWAGGWTVVQGNAAGVVNQLDAGGTWVQFKAADGERIQIHASKVLAVKDMGEARVG